MGLVAGLFNFFRLWLLDEKTKERLEKVVEYSKSDFVNIKYEGKVEKRLEGIQTMSNSKIL